MQRLSPEVELAEKVDIAERGEERELHSPALWVAGDRGRDWFRQDDYSPDHRRTGDAYLWRDPICRQRPPNAS